VQARLCKRQFTQHVAASYASLARHMSESVAEVCFDDPLCIFFRFMECYQHLERDLNHQLEMLQLKV
jgi:hypothetical protein